MARPARGVRASRASAGVGSTSRSCTAQVVAVVVRQRKRRARRRCAPAVPSPCPERRHAGIGGADTAARAGAAELDHRPNEPKRPASPRDRPPLAPGPVSTPASKSSVRRRRALAAPLTMPRANRWRRPRERASRRRPRRRLAQTRIAALAMRPQNVIVRGQRQRRAAAGTSLGRLTNARRSRTSEGGCMLPMVAPAPPAPW